MAVIPRHYRWTGDAFAPLSGRASKECGAEYIVGAVYRLVEVEDRSEASHRHCFAEINEVWKNLSDEQMERWPTPEHLRKNALIKCGFAKQRTFVASSRAEALRIMAFMKSTDEFALYLVKDNIITEWTAESMSYKAMGKQRFNECKTAILEFVSSLIGVTPEELTRNTGKAA